MNIVCMNALSTNAGNNLNSVKMAKSEVLKGIELVDIAIKRFSANDIDVSSLRRAKQSLEASIEAVNKKMSEIQSGLAASGPKFSIGTKFVGYEPDFGLAPDCVGYLELVKYDPSQDLYYFKKKIDKEKTIKFLTKKNEDLNRKHPDPTFDPAKQAREDFEYRMRTFDTTSLEVMKPREIERSLKKIG